MGHKSDTPDARLAEVAARQHGVVTLRQLEEAGVAREAASELKGIHLEGAERRRARSDLEEDFFALLDRHRPRLPLPETNVKIGRWEVDFLWREQRPIVETDCYLYHRGSIAFEDDHARDLDLRTAGYTVLRFTDTQLEGEPERVAALIAAELAR